jgi:hypothetical protein
LGGVSPVIARGFLKMPHQAGLAGASSGSRAAKNLRKHARTCVLVELAGVLRALLQIFRHDHAELALD